MKTTMKSTMLSLLLALPALSQAYTFSFDSWVQQCNPMSISLNGTGTPPYHLMLIPQGAYGPPEVRKILDYTFTDNKFQVDKLPYPANTQFLAVLSDASGIGSGGTSVNLRVETSSDTSCLPTAQVAPDFFFFLDVNPGAQCGSTSLRWDTATTQPPVTMYGIIPGGQSFELTLPTSGNVLTWQTNVKEGSTLFFVAGDKRGRGNGGSSSLFTIGPGSDACLATKSFATTLGNPAGGIFPTGGAAHLPSGETPTMSKGVIAGAVVGAVVGTIGLMVLLYLLYRWRKRREIKREAKQRGKEVDLIEGGINHHDHPGARETNNEQLAAEPFIIPARTHSRQSFSSATGTAARYSEDQHLGVGGGRRLSESTGTSDPRASQYMSEVGSDSGRRKSNMPPPSAMRNVNFIMHDDAGAVPDASDAPEVVELPPSYNSVRKPADGEPATAERA